MACVTTSCVQLLLCVLLVCVSSTYSRLLGARAALNPQQQQSPRSIVLMHTNKLAQHTSNRTILPPVQLRQSRLQKLVNFFESTTSQDSCYRKDRTMFQFYCPSPKPLADGGQRYICIRKEQLCNHIPDCPAAEDEDMQICMFYNAIQYELNTLKSMMSKHMSDSSSIDPQL